MDFESEIESKYETLLKKANKIEASHEVLVERRQEYEDEIQQKRKDIKVLEKVEELFKFLLDKHVHKYAESFSEIISEGLQTIFSDQNISFEAVVSQKRGKVWVDFETVQNGIRGPSLDSFGGGPSSIESLLLRLLVILKKKLAKYLILDESLAAVSEEYVPNTGNFIQKMCKELDVDILLITHNRDFLDYCDNAYEASLASDNSLVLEKK